MIGRWCLVVVYWLSVVGSFGWKPIPSVARVTRDEVSGLKQRKGSCLEDSTLPVYAHRIFLYILVLSSRQLFLLFFISRDFVPGYSRCARYCLPDKSYCVVVWLFCCFVGSIGNQQNNKTTRQFIDILLQIVCQSDRYLRNFSH